MKTYVMSDLHGQYEAYVEMLEKIGFDQFQEEKIYILGDVIDRGTGSIKILQHIMKNQDKITLLLGNHEMMMRECYENEAGDLCFCLQDMNKIDLWKRNGGEATFMEFMQCSSPEREEILQFLAQLPLFQELTIQGQNYYLVHAMPYGAKNSSASTSKMPQEKQMVWGTFESYENPHVTVIFGHRCTKLYDPRFDTPRILAKPGTYPSQYAIYAQDNFIAIDCGCAYEDDCSRLGCYCLEDKAEFYCKTIHDF